MTLRHPSTPPWRVVFIEDNLETLTFFEQCIEQLRT